MTIKPLYKKWLAKPAGLAAATGLAFGCVVTSAHASGIDPEADKVLKSMSTYVSGLAAVTVNADVDNEIIDLNGQKLQFSSSMAMTLHRPGGLHVMRQGPFADSELFFDGQTVTISVDEPAIYAQMEAKGTVDEAIAAVRSHTGMDAPAGDLFFADPYEGLLTDVISGTYYGRSFVDGVECHHLAFRAAKVDWQIWIQDGDAPLPMKYVITSKWVTGAPQFAVRFRDWNSNPKIDADAFAFTAAEGAKKIDSIPVHEMGELMLMEDK